MYLQLVGGCFLIYLGWKTFWATNDLVAKTPSHATVLKDFLSTFFLTITNPITIFSFFAVFAGLGLSYVNSTYMQALALVSGVFLGSIGWWVLLSEVVTLFRKGIRKKGMVWINRFAGILIFGFGIIALLTLR